MKSRNISVAAAYPPRAHQAYWFAHFEGAETDVVPGGIFQPLRHLSCIRLGFIGFLGQQSLKLCLEAVQLLFFGSGEMNNLLVLDSVCLGDRQPNTHGFGKPRITALESVMPAVAVGDAPLRYFFSIFGARHFIDYVCARSIWSTGDLAAHSGTGNRWLWRMMELLMECVGVRPKRALA